MICPQCQHNQTESAKCKKCGQAIKYLGRNKVPVTLEQHQRLEHLFNRFQDVISAKHNMNIYFTGNLEVNQRHYLYSLLDKTRWFLAQQHEVIDAVEFLEKIIDYIFEQPDFNEWANKITSINQCNGLPFQQSSVEILHSYRNERTKTQKQQQRLNNTHPTMVVRYEPII